jgi:integrase
MGWKVRALPKIDRKTKLQVGFRWDIRKYNPITRRNEPIPVAQIPEHIRKAASIEEVMSYCQSMAAQENAASARRQKLLEWKKVYQNFERLLDVFKDYQKRNAPNSWNNDVHYLETYALSFFLDKSPSNETNNILNWHLHFEEFRKWLSVVKPLKYSKDSLSLNTQNRVIKSLNVFLKMVGQQTGQVFPKCPVYPRDEVTQITIDDIYDEADIEAIKRELKNIRKDSYDFFVILANTALRENECLGLCLAFLTDGKIEGTKSSKIHEQLTKYGLGDYHGYICLESQPAVAKLRTQVPFEDRFKIKWSVGSVPRKPLKCRKKIDPKHFRYIPIFSKEAWNILVERYNNQKALWLEKRYGNDERDYLLFDGFTDSMFRRDLEKAFSNAKLKFKSGHKLRHTYCTWFYPKVNEDRFLAKRVTGHEDERTMSVYSHLNEQIGRERERMVRKDVFMKIAT